MHADQPSNGPRSDGGGLGANQEMGDAVAGPMASMTAEGMRVVQIACGKSSSCRRHHGDIPPVTHRHEILGEAGAFDERKIHSKAAFLTLRENKFLVTERLDDGAHGSFEILRDALMTM